MPSRNAWIGFAGPRVPERCRTFVAIVSVGVLAAVLGSTPSHAQVERQNLAQLTRLARDIVVATVVDVRDGVTAENVPFTEVAVSLQRTVKGELAGEYKFRQFGLLRPRPAAGGQTNVMLTPPGWPTYQVGDEVMLFLYRPGKTTGLRTTVGLTQGAFRIRDGEILSQAGNVGLFDGVDSVPVARLRRVRPASGPGPVDAAAFIDLVETAVRERWFDGVQ